MQTRAYLRRQAAAETGQLLSAHQASAPDQVPELIRKLLRLGPTLLSEAMPTLFGVRCGGGGLLAAPPGLRCACRSATSHYASWTATQIATGVSGEMLRPLLESGADIRMHVNNGAVASFVDTIPLLYPHGRLICHDLQGAAHPGIRPQGLRGLGGDPPVRVGPCDRARCGLRHRATLPTVEQGE